MHITMMKAKLHRATVTQCDMDYVGSISIDRDFMDAAGILNNEQVDVLNINNGERLTTYAIEAERGSKIIGLNGAAARKAEKGDRVIIIAYCSLHSDEAKTHEPNVIIMGDDNVIMDS